MCFSLFDEEGERAQGVEFSGEREWLVFKNPVLSLFLIPVFASVSWTLLQWRLGQCVGDSSGNTANLFVFTDKFYRLYGQVSPSGGKQNLLAGTGWRGWSGVYFF